MNVIFIKIPSELFFQRILKFAIYLTNTNKCITVISKVKQVEKYV